MQFNEQTSGQLPGPILESKIFFFQFTMIFLLKALLTRKSMLLQIQIVTDFKTGLG